MHDQIYEAMEECCVVTQNIKPTSIDRMGIKCVAESLFGLRCTHTLEYQGIHLVVNEVGSNLSQKGDGHIGETK